MGQTAQAGAQGSLGSRTRDGGLSKAASAYLGWCVRHVLPAFQVPQDVDDLRLLLAARPAAPGVPSAGLDILPCSWAPAGSDSCFASPSHLLAFSDRKIHPFPEMQNDALVQ